MSQGRNPTAPAHQPGEARRGVDPESRGVTPVAAGEIDSSDER
jgi:hypothetical protein